MLAKVPNDYLIAQFSKKQFKFARGRNPLQHGYIVEKINAVLTCYKFFYDM